jgi:hypothetical protein
MELSLSHFRDRLTLSLTGRLQSTIDACPETPEVAIGMVLMWTEIMIILHNRLVYTRADSPKFFNIEFS